MPCGYVVCPVNFEASPYEKRRAAIRSRRVEIAAARASLDAELDALAREEGRMDAEEAQAVEPTMLTSADVMKMLNLPERSFYRLIANSARGFPKPMRGNRRHRFDRNEVAAWREANKR